MTFDAITVVVAFVIGLAGTILVTGIAPSIDNLAVGVDPEKVTYFLQSLVPQIPELHLYFSMLVSVPRVQRIPTLKDQLRDHGLAQPTYGLLGYPVLQAADILCVQGDVVPVGKDNHAHVDVTREIARRFNHLYGDVFPVPLLVESERSGQPVGVWVGTDHHVERVCGHHLDRVARVVA